MKTKLLIVFLSILFLAGIAMAQGIGQEPGQGWVYYAYIDVTWDGSSPNGNWYVYAPDGTPIMACDDCLAMDYDFECLGNTLQFSETYVAVVPAFPQTHHVVLHDQDRDGIYTGSITARYEWPLGTRRMDVIEYEVTVDGNCTVTDFFYREHEFKQKNDV